MSHNKILQTVADYYTDKVQQHGTSHWGVDWNSKESQFLRFQQLLQLHQSSAPFTINDYGCGYGALVEYMTTQQHTFTYHGYDVSAEMIQAAEKQYQGLDHVKFSAEDSQLQTADYTVASGIFNVRVDTPDDQWLDYMLQTLAQLWEISQLGMAFNCLTSYSDPEYMRPHLYYTDPRLMFDYCKKHFSKQVALLHDYGLYEFTILVRREK